jgi:hypothetical protein
MALAPVQTGRSLRVRHAHVWAAAAFPLVAELVMAKKTLSGNRLAEPSRPWMQTRPRVGNYNAGVLERMRNNPERVSTACVSVVASTLIEPHPEPWRRPA